jgi:hypothetical protein
MTLKEILDKWFDKTIPYPDPDPYKLQGQCVQFIRYCLEMFYGFPQWKPQRGAADFWDSYDTDHVMYCFFDRIPNTPDFVPQEGDICIWNKNKGGGYGHIAIVYGEEQNVNMMTCIEQNWQPLKVSVVTHNYNDVIGFLRLKENT